MKALAVAWVVGIAPTKALVVAWVGGTAPTKAPAVVWVEAVDIAPMKALVEEWVLVVAIGPMKALDTGDPMATGLMMSLVTEATTTEGHPLTSTVAMMALAMEEGATEGMMAACIQSFPALGSFLVSQFFTSGGQSIVFQLQHQSFQCIFRADFL